MNLNGNTTIQLFDAKTGKKTDEVSKNNLVTNAVNNVLNGALNALVAGLNNGIGIHDRIDYLYRFPDGYNIAKALFGGVLIFSNRIQSDAEHCIPTIDEMKSFIGCANQSATITGSIFRGSINKSESEVGDNYVKFVWDFTTEQCNGDIASICLTSNIGGCEGYKFNVKSSEYDAHFLSWLYEGMWDSSSVSKYYAGYNAHNPMFQSSFTNSNEHGMYIYENNFYYVYVDKVYKYNIDKILNKYGSDILSRFNLGDVSKYDEVITLTDYGNRIFDCLDGDKVYEVTNTESNNTLTLIRISKNAVSETIAIPTTNIMSSIRDYLNEFVPYINLRLNSCIYKDKIYTIVGWINNKDLNVKPNKLRIYILSFDGSFTFKDLNLTDNMISMLFGTKGYGGGDSTSGLKFLRIFDNLVLQASDGTNGYAYYLVSDDGDVNAYPFMHTVDSLYYYGNILYKNSGWLKEPWCSFKLCGNGMVNSIEMIAPYLATINNQDVVLTKTADKTMKIIYTLTQE